MGKDIIHSLEKDRLVPGSEMAWLGTGLLISISGNAEVTYQRPKP